MEGEIGGMWEVGPKNMCEMTDWPPKQGSLNNISLFDFIDLVRLSFFLDFYFRD